MGKEKIIKTGRAMGMSTWAGAFKDIYKETGFVVKRKSSGILRLENVDPMGVVKKWTYEENQMN